MQPGLQQVEAWLNEYAAEGGHEGRLDALASLVTDLLRLGLRQDIDWKAVVALAITTVGTTDLGADGLSDAELTELQSRVVSLRDSSGLES